jgi:hypothetical protein
LHFRGKGNGCFPKSPLDETRSSNFDTRSTKCGEKRECNYFAASHPSVLVAGASPHERVSNGCTRACIQEKYDASYQHHRAESALRCRKPNGKPSAARDARRTLNTRRHVLWGASVTTNFRWRARSQSNRWWTDVKKPPRGLARTCTPLLACRIRNLIGATTF